MQPSNFSGSYEEFLARLRKSLRDQDINESILSLLKIYLFGFTIFSLFKEAGFLILVRLYRFTLLSSGMVLPSECF